MNKCVFISFRASLFCSKFYVVDQSNSYYGGGGGGGYLQGGSPFSASGSPGGGRVSRCTIMTLREIILIHI